MTTNIQNLVWTKKYVQNGEEKKQYVQCGKLLTYQDGGQQVIIESLPIGFDGKLNVYNVKHDTSNIPV